MHRVVVARVADIHAGRWRRGGTWTEREGLPIDVRGVDDPPDAAVSARRIDREEQRLVPRVVQAEDHPRLTSLIAAAEFSTSSRDPRRWTVEIREPRSHRVRGSVGRRLRSVPLGGKSLTARRGHQARQDQRAVSDTVW